MYYLYFILQLISMKIVFFKFIIIFSFLIISSTFSKQKMDVCNTLLSVITVNTNAYKNCLLQKPGDKFSREELNTAANSLFEKIKYGKIKIEIFKEYPLSDARKAHQDLEERKILGSALLVPNE